MKTIKTLTQASCYFILIRFGIFSSIFFDRNWLDHLNYHHQNEWSWYLTWWIVPLTISILFSIKFSFKFFEQTGFLVLPILFIGTILMGIKNKEYWGYYYKRPAIFNEVKNLSSINSIIQINTTSINDPFNISQEALNIHGFNEIEDPYYENHKRVFATIFENLPNEFQRWLNPPDNFTKITHDDLSLILSQLKENILFISGIEGNDKYGINSLSGFLLDFYSKDNNRYLYIYLSGGEVKNDHYPSYEFLHRKNDEIELIRKQMYFTDFAGIEGLEYCNIATPLELLLFLGSGIIILLFRGFIWIQTQRKNRKIITPVRKDILDNDL